MKKPLLIDVDGVCADFVTSALEVLNEVSSVQYSYSEVVKDIRKLDGWNEECENFVRSPGFCSNLKLLPGAKEGIQCLTSYGYKVMFLTSPYENSPTWCHERTKWIEKHFDMDRNSVIFARSKQYVSGIGLIDDHPINIGNWGSYNKPLNLSGHLPLLFHQPWNKSENVDGATRVHSWKEIIQIMTGYGYGGL